MDIHRILIIAFPVLLGLTVHECAHGWMAKRLGDPTAERMGRITLNPLPHLDLMGTIMLFFSGLIGWAKPVPVDPRYFKNPARDMGLVALAGPVSNLIVAFFFGLLLKIMFGFEETITANLSESMISNIISILLMGVIINVGLAIFNLLPLPPLDGFRVASIFMPRKWVIFGLQYSFIWMLILIALMLLGVIGEILNPLRFSISSLFLPDEIARAIFK